jgi:hypothetical protein
MTAPGQEPDEILTANPGGTDPAEPKLDEIGDNHMPEDLRRAERGEEPESSDPAVDPESPPSEETD